MYLEMLQQKYGSGLEKRSAALFGRAIRALGKGMGRAGSKLTDKGTMLADPALRRFIAERIKGENKLYANIVKGLAETMPVRSALLGGGLVGSGVGAGILADELVRRHAN